jgi:hypothetical protein
VLADELATAFYQLLDEGMEVGEASLRAKMTLLERALERDGGVSAPLHNTLLSFTAYGSPTARAASPRAAGAKPRSVLDSARAALERRMALHGGWQVVSSGRATMRSIAAQYREGPSVEARLAALLGSAPSEAHLLRYRAPEGERATITASMKKNAQVFLVAVNVDRDGRVLQSFVSR